MYMELYPDKIKGFISIDSAPLQKSYMTAVEIWLLERVEPLYRIYPCKALLRAGSRGCSATVSYTHLPVIILIYFFLTDWRLALWSLVPVIVGFLSYFGMMLDLSLIHI